MELNLNGRAAPITGLSKGIGVPLRAPAWREPGLNRTGAVCYIARDAGSRRIDG